MKKYLKFVFIVVFMAVAMAPYSTFAHPGRTDSSGCHTCRTNCPRWGLDSGEYHCHRSKGVTQPLEPIKSHRGPVNGVGFTTPAPEYKEPAPIKVTPKASISKEIKQDIKNKQEGWLRKFLKSLF